MPAHRPPPPIGTTSVSIGGLVGQHLDRRGALAGDHQRVVVRVHERVVALAGELLRDHRRLGDRLTAQHDLGAESLGALDLRERRRQRHHDHRLHAEPAGMERDALRVVAGRGRGDAGRRLRRLRQALQLQAAAAVLERTGVLQVLELQEQAVAELLAEAHGLDGRRALDVAGDRAVGLRDVLGGYRHGRPSVASRPARCRTGVAAAIMRR